MHCPRCYGSYFYDGKDVPYGVVCGTCGLLGKYELKRTVEFVPVHNFQGGWNTPITRIWESNYGIVNDPTGQYSWCHAFNQACQMTRVRLTPDPYNPAPFFPMIGWRPYSHQWGNWGNDWGSWPTPTSPLSGECTEHSFTNAVTDSPPVTVEDLKESLKKLGSVPSPPKNPWIDPFWKSFIDEGMINYGTERVPTDKEDTRKDQEGKGQEDRGTEFFEKPALYGFPMRLSYRSKSTPGPTEGAGNKGTPEVPIRDWCI
jgi:hypothetical protein